MNQRVNYVQRHAPLLRRYQGAALRRAIMRLREACRRPLKRPGVGEAVRGRMLKRLASDGTVHLELGVGGWIGILLPDACHAHLPAYRALLKRRPVWVLIVKQQEQGYQVSLTAPNLPVALLRQQRDCPRVEVVAVDRRPGIKSVLKVYNAEAVQGGGNIRARRVAAALCGEQVIIMGIA